MKIDRICILNYKTLENIDIPINTYYTAICGKNNAGKSSLIQAIRTILGSESSDPFDYSSDFEVTHKTDFTKWKAEKIDPISFCLYLSLDKSLDTGLIKFIEKFLKKNEGEIVEEKDHYILQISIKFHQDKSNPEIGVQFDEDILDDFGSREVLSKIRTSKALIFHNSTEVARRYSPYHGWFDDFTENERISVKSKREILQKEFKKISDRHKKDLTDLLGRLSEKYDINLTVPGFSFEKVPYEISLGEKDFDIPLDNWGSGTKNRTLILKSLFNAKKFLETSESSRKIAPIVLIEEPESFLHPSAQAEFGKLLQDLATEFKIQIITTTHSPFILSNLDDPTANILLDRQFDKKKPRATIKVETTGKDWKKPFALALGIDSPEFDNIRSVFFSTSNSILLVEGETDKEYLELLKDERHGKHKLDFDGEIYSYGGFGTLNSTVMLKFLIEKYNKLVITFDLDAFRHVRKSLESLRLQDEKDFFKVGIDSGGKRAIEGLLPGNIFNKVWSANTELVQQSQSDNKEEAESAKDRLKKLYLDEFKQNAQPGEEYYGQFYKLTAKLNKAFKNK
ncbi:hypothetical protein KACHI17_06950 [Sediminibacterium sp. KACHI17]|uniref:Endonuclease GajA/Old nuclease/RecF-like AAA domain-containing protein n=1 Tax=Sediminibacterium sp. KACHI17 TaxID=1751071 RepID=A0AAT9GH21_9BACT